ncbi:MAG: hypothetical protein JEZ09_06530 [Salinivirgaceae bacterium]|nr:hypothetical protein [Salinivirgaceae bacterium]
MFEKVWDELKVSRQKEWLKIYEIKRLKVYNARIAKADSVFVNKEYGRAVELYTQASIIDSYSNYPYIQLDMIKHIEEQDAKYQICYDKNIQIADEYYDIKSYKKAKRLYEKALRFKDEDYPKEQLSKIIKIVSLREVLAVQ